MPVWHHYEILSVLLLQLLDRALNQIGWVIFAVHFGILYLVFHLIRGYYLQAHSRLSYIALAFHDTVSKLIYIQVCEIGDLNYSSLLLFLYEYLHLSSVVMTLYFLFHWRVKQ